jgi:hypothetical protein
MTIGIAAVGPNAGRAVFEALAAVERVSRGAVGGFAAFVAITADGRMLRFATQRGGTRTLFVEGETTGVGPPPEVAAARIAGVMSSGPDRPKPLDQFVPADERGRLVTGHRLPNVAGVNGEAINVEVLRAMGDGLSAKDAVDRALDANPEADAGLIAVDTEGRIYARNSARVERRPDIGGARREDAVSGSLVEVLHNAIFPYEPVASLAASVAMEVMAPQFAPDAYVTVHAGTPLEAGSDNAVLVDRDMVAQRVVTTDRYLLQGRQDGAAIYLNSLVWLDGRLLGRTVTEPYVVVEHGRILSLSGQSSCRLGIQSAE